MDLAKKMAKIHNKVDCTFNDLNIKIEALTSKVRYMEGQTGSTCAPKVTWLPGKSIQTLKSMPSLTPSNSVYLRRESSHHWENGKTIQANSITSTCSSKEVQESLDREVWISCIGTTQWDQRSDVINISFRADSRPLQRREKFNTRKDQEVSRFRWWIWCHSVSSCSWKNCSRKVGRFWILHSAMLYHAFSFLQLSMWSWSFSQLNATLYGKEAWIPSVYALWPNLDLLIGVQGDLDTLSRIQGGD